MKRSVLGHPIQAALLCLALASPLAGMNPARAQTSANNAGSSDERATGQTQGTPPAASEQAPGAAQKAEASDTASVLESYRHSAAVQFIARKLNISVETAAKTFEYLNFAILAGSILYFIFKLVPKMFRGRRDAIAKHLLDARSATEQANERLRGVEERLSRIDEEIASIRRQVEEDAIHDEARIKATLEEDKKRIAQAAGQEVEAAGTAAQRELRRFAAELAVKRATERLTLTPEIDRLLVSNFAREIADDASSPGDTFRGGRN